MFIGNIFTKKSLAILCFFVASLVKPPHVPPPIGSHVPIISKFHFEGSLDLVRFPDSD